MTSTEQQRRVNSAKNEFKRKIQQMLSSGDHDIGAIKDALVDILEGWV